MTATRSEDSRTLVLKVVNLEARPVRAAIEIEGFEVRSPTARASELSGDLKARNTPEEPERIAERERMFPWDGSCTFPPHSFTVLTLR